MRLNAEVVDPCTCTDPTCPRWRGLVRDARGYWRRPTDAERAASRQTRRWAAGPHSHADKRFSITGPGELRLEVDYDDVFHDAVDAAVEVLVDLLNGHADELAAAEDNVGTEEL